MSNTTNKFSHCDLNLTGNYGNFLFYFILSLALLSLLRVFPFLVVQRMGKTSNVGNEIHLFSTNTFIRACSVNCCLVVYCLYFIYFECKS